MANWQDDGPLRCVRTPDRPLPSGNGRYSKRRGARIQICLSDEVLPAFFSQSDDIADVPPAGAAPGAYRFAPSVIDQQLS